MVGGRVVRGGGTVLLRSQRTAAEGEIHMASRVKIPESGIK